MRCATSRTPCASSFDVQPLARSLSANHFSIAAVSAGVIVTTRPVTFSRMRIVPSAGIKGKSAALNSDGAVVRSSFSPAMTSSATSVAGV